MIRKRNFRARSQKNNYRSRNGSIASHNPANLHSNGNMGLEGTVQLIFTYCRKNNA